MNAKQLVSGIVLSLLFISFVIPSIQAVATRQTAMLDYIEQCKVGPGFGNTPAATVPTLESTFQALYILNAYSQLAEVNENALIKWVNSCRNADHGYGNTNHTAVVSDITSTYYATWILDLFDRSLDNRTDEWVVACRNISSSFGDEINGTATLSATYYALETLYLNNTNLKAYNVSTWILERQNIIPSSLGYGGFATDRNSSNMGATWAAIGAVKRLNTGGYLLEPLISWINRSQNTVSYDDNFGAFSTKPTETDWSLLNTYTAIHSLQMLGTSYLARINLSATLDWLITLQNADGGFRVNSFTGASSLSATYYAFRTLELVNQKALLSENVPWESPFELPIWAWVLIAIGIGIAAIFIIKKFYLD
ncbi:MAG: terpene cyclase/mutase family protein [Candidatus Helarchaeota archaeon]|nr:terpene cyclase/mutase family protein [Candidatus Helarchaeota archaeon]